jgi:GxxExxY protein
MQHDDITHRIIGCAYRVYRQLAFGFLESVYKKAMVIELNKNGLKSEMEKPLDVFYDGQVVGEYFIDLFIEDKIVVELKAIEKLVKQHEVQLVNYLNGMKQEIGLLINFGPLGVETKRKIRTPLYGTINPVNPVQFKNHK